MDMRELLSKLDNIGTEIAEESTSERIEEGQYDGKSREELLKMKADAEADIKNMKPSGDSPQHRFYDETQMMMAQRHLDDINDALKKVDEVVEAVGDFAQPIYDLMDEIGVDSNHPILNDLIRYLDGDTIKDFVDEFRRMHDYGNGLESDYTEDTVAESDIDQIAEVGKVYPKIKKMKMELVDGGMEPEEAHEKACEKYGVDPAMCDKYIEMQRDAKEDTVAESDKELESYIQEMDSDDQVQEDCACEDTVEETVEVAVDDLRSLIALAGLQPQASTEATTELGEYANSPDEDYQDTDVQLNKMSGGLNGPKGQHKKEYPGDNPLAAELAEKLKAMLEK